MEEKCKKCGTTKRVNFDGMCGKCYEDSIIIHPKEETQDIEKNKDKMQFWKNKKNVAIVILSFIIVCFLFSSSGTEIEELSGKENTKNAELNQQLEESMSQIKILQGQNEKLQEEKQRLQGNDSKIVTLQESNQKLQDEKLVLEEQKNELEQEKASLQAQNEELNAKIQQIQSTQSASKTAISSTATSSEIVSNTNSGTVYITDTGKKYHSGGCSYLKNSKHEISKSSAKAQGYMPCSRCNP